MNNFKHVIRYVRSWALEEGLLKLGAIKKLVGDKKFNDDNPNNTCLLVYKDIVNELDKRTREGYSKELEALKIGSILPQYDNKYILYYNLKNFEIATLDTATNKKIFYNLLGIEYMQGSYNYNIPNSHLDEISNILQDTFKKELIDNRGYTEKEIKQSLDELHNFATDIKTKYDYSTKIKQAHVRMNLGIGTEDDYVKQIKRSNAYWNMIDTTRQKNGLKPVNYRF